VFSLSGLVGVLAFADQMQPQPKAAVPPRVANAPSGEESPPRAQAAPAQQAGAPPSAKPVPAQGAGDAPAAKPAPATAPVSRKRGARSVRQFSCRGQEPFWTLRIDNDTARYVTLTDGGSKEPMTLSGKLSITGEGATPVTDWRGKSDWGARYRAVISEERCVDTMSDAEGNTEFAYRVALTLPDGKTVSGCCAEGLDAARATRTPGAAEKIVDTTQYPVADLSSKPETQWTHHLSDFLLAIQACIDATPEPDPYATKAWPINRGMVGVRTRNRDGGWFECISDTQGREVEHIGRLPPGTKPAPNEDYAIFSPPDQPPPAGNCYRHERVMDGMGDFRGWLSTHNC